MSNLRIKVQKTIQSIHQCNVRGKDCWGFGHYGASRGERTHVGIDYIANAGDEILSPVQGEVTKFGYPYSDDLSYRYVQVTDAQGVDHRFFYVEPLDEHLLHSQVCVGDVLGVVQNIGLRYKDITPHFHYEIKLPNGKHVDPESFWS